MTKNLIFLIKFDVKIMEDCAKEIILKLKNINCRYTSKRGIIHIWKNVTEFKTLKIAFGLSFFNLCVNLFFLIKFDVKIMEDCAKEIILKLKNINWINVVLDIIFWT
jgi:hypothetical protein